MKALTALRHPAITSARSAKYYVVRELMLASKMDSILLMIPYMACKTLVVISVEDSSATNVKLKKELNVCSIVKGARENIALVAIQWNNVIYATMRNAASAMPLKLA